MVQPGRKVSKARKVRRGQSARKVHKVIPVALKVRPARLEPMAATVLPVPKVRPVK